MNKKQEKIVKQIEKIRKRKISLQQKNIISKLIKGEIVTFQSFCKSQTWYSNYTVSWKKLISDLRSIGLNIKVLPGKMGGTWTEKINMVNMKKINMIKNKN